MTNILLVLSLLLNLHQSQCFVVNHSSKQIMNSKSARPSPSRTRATHRHMFTGIVEEMGNVISLEEDKEMEMWDKSIGVGTELTIHGDIVMEDAYLG